MARANPNLKSSAGVRRELVEALRLDLIGPPASDPTHPLAREVLFERDLPTRWYLTGFLAPIDAPEEDRQDEDAGDDIGGVEVGDATDDNAGADQGPAKQPLYSASIGVSVLVPPEVARLQVQVAWGEYERVEVGQDELDAMLAARRAAEREIAGAAVPEDVPSDPTEPAKDTEGGDEKRRSIWRRIPKVPAPIALDLTTEHDEIEVPGSAGMMIKPVIKTVQAISGTGEARGFAGAGGARVVSVYLVNRRVPGTFGSKDAANAFQAELALTLPAGGPGFVARPDTHGRLSEDPDEKTADLQYRDVMELAVGHGVATTATHDHDGQCREVRTTWIPESTVLRVEPKPIREVEVTLDPEALGRLETEASVRKALAGLPDAYAQWISVQRNDAVTELSGDNDRLDWATSLLQRAEQARIRIAKGVELVATDIQVRRAFALMNRVIARAGRRRNAVIAGKQEHEVKANTWRPFQLAFILLALEGVADARSVDRRIADLLFFPTGGGKTEAYLGLAALAMVLRRLRSPGKPEGYRGTSVLMRYTLRLLTLDQLGRAAGLICALELERLADVKALGSEPFEIGLWVGSKATPNRMGSSRDKNPEQTARYKVRRYKSASGGPLPVPLESCPWCGHAFEPNSFKLEPDEDDPTDLDIRCTNLECEPVFRKRLPIITVDEPLYQRLPAFIIATVDKFASLPWSADAGRVLGSAHAADRQGEGAVRSAAKAVRPPDLIIQDELHLISGPLGTMVGLYEAGIDALSADKLGERWLVPKVIASTATVRRADRQVRALFARTQTALFPPPGPNRRDSFFAEESNDPDTGRLYVGVAAPGRSGKVILLRAYQALLSAAKRLWDEARATLPEGAENPVDPYMTLLGYFGALRELGGSRRIVEDEVHSTLQNRGRRRRLNDPVKRFADRYIAFEPVELTSRESTAKVAEAKGRLGLTWVDRIPSGTKDSERCVDVALATNMISVGLDIPRLGLMVVLGQPKSSAEYIQATSRVGRQAKKPGLVVTLLSIHKPRDRSHYERFDYFQRTFYRAVEATSVTPFSLRALDRALPAVVIAMARHGSAELTGPEGAAKIAEARKRGPPNVESWIVDRLVARAKEHVLTEGSPEEQAEAAHLEGEVRARVRSVLDGWQARAEEAGGNLRYQKWEGVSKKRPKKGEAAPADGATQAVLLRDMLAPDTWRYRAPWSMRDVEPEIPVWVKTMNDERDLEEGD